MVNSTKSILDGLDYLKETNEVKSDDKHTTVEFVTPVITENSVSQPEDSVLQKELLPSLTLQKLADLCFGNENEVVIKKFPK